MADAKLVLGIDDKGALAGLTAFKGKVKAALTDMVTPAGGVGSAKGLTDAFGNLQQTTTRLDQVRAAAGATIGQLGGVAAGVAIFHELEAAVSATADEQVRLNTTLKSMDVGTLTGAVAAYNTQLDTMVERQRMATQGGLGGLLSALPVAFMNAKQGLTEAMSGSTAEEDVARVKARRLATIDFDEGQKQRKMMAASAGAKLQSLQFTQVDLLARGDLPGAEAGAKAIEAQQEEASQAARDALKSDQARRRAAELAVSGATPESVEKSNKMELLALDEELILSGQRRRQTNQRGIEDLRQLTAEVANLREQLERDRTTQDATALAADQQRSAQRRALVVQTTSQIAEAEEALADQIDAAQGRIVDNVKAVNAERRRDTIATARAQVDALQAGTTGKLQGLGGKQASTEAQLAALTGLPSTPDVEKRRIGLLSQIQETQAQITEAAREGADARANIEIKLAADLRKLQLREHADRLALLQKAIGQENNLRTEARNLLTQALSNAGQIKGQEVDEFSVTSKSMLAGDLAQQKRDDERVLREHSLGQMVNTMELQGALGRQGFQEQLEKFGGLGAATDIAGTKPSALPGELTGAEQFRQAQSQIATLSAEVATSIQGIKGSFADSLGEVPGLMKNLMGELVTIVETGKSQVAKALASMVQDDLTRAFADAQRRM